MPVQTMLPAPYLSYWKTQVCYLYNADDQLFAFHKPSADDHPANDSHMPPQAHCQWPHKDGRENTGTTNNRYVIIKTH